MSDDTSPTPPSGAGPRDALLKTAMRIADAPWQDEASRLVAVELLLDAADAVSRSEADDRERRALSLRDEAEAEARAKTEERARSSASRRKEAFMRALPALLEIVAAMTADPAEEPGTAAAAPPESEPEAPPAGG